MFLAENKKLNPDIRAVIFEIILKLGYVFYIPYTDFRSTHHKKAVFESVGVLFHKFVYLKDLAACYQLRLGMLGWRGGIFL